MPEANNWRRSEYRLKFTGSKKQKGKKKKRGEEKKKEFHPIRGNVSSRMIPEEIHTRKYRALCFIVRVLFEY